MRSYRVPQAHCLAGVARRDVTPPVDIHSRNWGAALHDNAEGIHRPFTATALALQASTGNNGPLVLLALDLGWLEPEENEMILQNILTGTGLERSQLMVALSHTHSGPNLTLSLENRPGGHLIRPYFERLVGTSINTVQEAMSSLKEVWIAFGSARCSLARNRDAWDEESQQYVCGFNPESEADDTVMLARLTDLKGNTVATLVNYGCHPTTLGPENRLLSPDYVGSTREVLEKHFGAPSLFILGPCGDTAPREGYVADVAVADRNGRQLGLAAASGLESLPPTGVEMVYTGPILSGATLGAWTYRPASPDTAKKASIVRARVIHHRLPLKSRESVEDLKQRYQQADRDLREAMESGDPVAIRDARALHERIRRHLLRVPQLPTGETMPFDFWLWQVGEAFLLGIPGEPYSVLQTELRQRFPERAILISVVTNGTIAYLLPRQLYGKGLYQDWISFVGAGSLEMLIQRASQNIQRWL